MKSVFEVDSRQTDLKLMLSRHRRGLARTVRACEGD